MYFLNYSIMNYSFQIFDHAFITSSNVRGGICKKMNTDSHYVHIISPLLLPLITIVSHYCYCYWYYSSCIPSIHIIFITLLIDIINWITAKLLKYTLFYLYMQLTLIVYRHVSTYIKKYSFILHYKL